jgi:hypothetical protein
VKSNRSLSTSERVDSVAADNTSNRGALDIFKQDKSIEIEVVKWRAAFPIGRDESRTQDKRQQ